MKIAIIDTNEERSILKKYALLDGGWYGESIVTIIPTTIENIKVAFCGCPVHIIFCHRSIPFSFVRELKKYGLVKNNMAIFKFYEEIKDEFVCLIEE